MQYFPRTRIIFSHGDFLSLWIHQDGRKGDRTFLGDSECLRHPLCVFIISATGYRTVVRSSGHYLAMRMFLKVSYMPFHPNLPDCHAFL